MVGIVDVAPVSAAVCVGFATALVVRPRADRRACAVAMQDDRAPAVNSQTRPALETDRAAALLELIAAALDVGLAPVGALAAVAVGVPEPDRSRLRRALAMVDMSSDTAWRLLADDPVLGPLAHALERSERSGAPVAAAVRGLADETRRETRTARLAEARRVGVRTAAPLGACFLPAFFLTAIVPTVIALMRSVL
ncbi:MAG TPA: type II secretion system F family protein [Aeromicrobium sp.]|nr:type II secretion system F family protein [Aeromicrobium sp.]